MPDRSTPEGEQEFRRQQKQQEIEALLPQLPENLEKFLSRENWRTNASKNLLLIGTTTVTIFSKDNGFNWVVAGGKASYGPGGFTTINEAMENLWEFFMEFTPK